MTEHYVRYVNLAVNMQTPLTEYNLETFTKRKKRKDVLQRERKGGGYLRTCVIVHLRKLYGILLYCISLEVNVSTVILEV
jgi:hypothetical protein